MSVWTIYWILKLDTLQALFGLGSVVFFCISVVGVVVYISWLNKRPHYSWEKENDGSPNKDFIKAKEELARWIWLWKLTPIAVLFLFIALAIPSTNQMATIIVAPQIINNEKLQQMPDKLLDLGNQQLDKWLKDIKDEANLPTDKAR